LGQPDRAGHQSYHRDRDRCRHRAKTGINRSAQRPFMASNPDAGCDPDSDSDLKEKKMLTVGSPAPRFDARTQDGRIVRLDDFIGRKNVVLFFFSRQGTPG